VGVFFFGRHHLQAAQAAWNREAFDEAEAKLKLCLKVWPRSYQAHLLAARVARRQHAFAAAQEHLARCEDLQAKTEDVKLESILLQVQQGRFAGLEEPLFRLVVENGPNAPVILEALAEGYVRSFEQQKAFIAIQELLKRQPDNYSGFLIRGKLQESQSQDESALEDYEHAVALKPEADEIRLQLANVLLKLGRPRQAIAQFRCLRERQPDSLPVALSLARCLQDLAQLDEARELLDSILAAHPEHAAALVERGRLAIRRAEWQDAETRLSKAVSLAPYDREAHLVYHACLDAEHKRVEADKILAIVLRLDTDLAYINELTAKLRQMPGNSALASDLGILLLRNGREEEGRHWLERALQRDSGNVAARAALQELWRRRNIREDQ
ncbi:MAG TPA: tetratricopeptide repeat protein, partial [Gemmataceae bacterium]|nr:tetratricopeptide repeat protein [Gemmataceae bacterium]